jgi:hypothetical protein
MRAPPPDALFAQDAADLAASDLDALRLGGCRQRIEGPIRDVTALALGESERPIGVGDQPAGRGTGDQGDHGAALRCGQARLASAPGLHPQPIKATLVEGVEAFADRLWVAIQFLGNKARTQPIPAAHDHPGMQHPVGGGMQTPRQTPNLAFFRGIEGRASSE